MSRSVKEKRAAFKALHQQGCFIIPNPYDVGTARMLEGLGFKALATTSSGFAWTQGLPDGERVTREVTLDHLRTLAAATDLPLNADFESGYAKDAAGVAESELQSSQIQIAPNYTDRQRETEQVRFYIVSQTISATLHDVKKVPDVTADVVLAGATSVRDVSLRSSALRKYRDDARVLAIRAAREKAAALTAELGVKVGKPYTITEGMDYGHVVSSSNSYNNIQQVEVGAAAGDGTMPTFAPGTISISASVSVSFLLE